MLERARVHQRGSVHFAAEHGKAKDELIETRSTRSPLRGDGAQGTGKNRRPHFLARSARDGSPSRVVAMTRHREWVELYAGRDDFNRFEDLRER